MKTFRDFLTEKTIVHLLSDKKSSVPYPACWDGPSKTKSFTAVTLDKFKKLNKSDMCPECAKKIK